MALTVSASEMGGGGSEIFLSYLVVFLAVLLLLCFFTEEYCTLKAFAIFFALDWGLPLKFILGFHYFKSCCH